ncbi:hypothetical protein AB0L82_20215 [Nocardia sp. NPDC052001]|uniref:hypothetical protein n=1 Tax=Nocardia sp. NPDC052001 TaxID=3154853 RepID=UPI003436C96B
MSTRGALGSFGLAAVALAALLTGCGGSDEHSGHSSQTSQSIAALPQQNSSASAVQSSVAADPEVTIGEVPGYQAAARALRPFIRNLLAGDMDQLVRKCWTIEPQNARNMYADRDGILAAVAQPGVDGQFAAIWTGPALTVSAKRSEIGSGYACPRVAANGTVNTFNEADARYTVQRYLSRWVGKPVDVNDIEGKYPLVCPGSVLSNNPGRLTGTTGFGEFSTQPTGISDVDVTVPVTNSSGVTQPMLFKTAIGPEGYCINDLS